MNRVWSACLVPAAVTGLAMLAGCAGPRTLSKSETVIFQPAVCYQKPDGAWNVLVRGEVFKRSMLDRIEPEIVEWLLSHHMIENRGEATILEARLEPLLADHVKHAELAVLVEGDARPLPVADGGGRIIGPLALSADEVKRLAGQGGWVSVPLRMGRGDKRTFPLDAQVLPATGISVVSDIDDTIKITDVNNTKLAMRNTFLLPFRAVPGMAEVYATWQQERGAVFHYLSESPVEFEAPLKAFLAEAGYPRGTLDFREIDWSGSRWKGLMQMMDAPPKFKVDQLKLLIDALPHRDYVLVGDSSQHDPEVYAEIARDYPRQVKRILIRDVTCEGPDAPRYQETFKGLSRELWQIFREPAEIRDAVRA